MKETITSLPNGEGYKSVDLSSGSQMVEPNRRCIQFYPHAEKPAFIKAGKNILRLTLLGTQPNPRFGYEEEVFELENLSAINDEAKIRISERTVVGRLTTPELQLDESASREHLEIGPMRDSVAITDLNSTNSTIVEAPNFHDMWTRDYTDLLNQLRQDGELN